MSQSGNSTYTKSMNGIITFDDGAGTVIQDGEIITDSFSTTDFTASTIETNQISSITPTNPMNLFTTTTGTIILGGSGQIQIGSNIAITNKTFVTPAVTDTVNLFNNITTGFVNMCKMIFSQNSIASSAVTDTVNLFNNITTGTVNIAKTKFKQNSIESALSSDYFNICNNITTGTLDILSGVRTAGALNIACNTGALNTAPVNIGGTNTSALVGQITNINLNLNGNNVWSNTDIETSLRTGGTINLATFVGSPGNINIGAEASTTSNVTIGRSGNGKATNLTGSTMTINPSVSCTINSGSFSVTGSPCNILTSTTGSINIGDQAGTTSGALGNIYIGNDANSLTSANNGIVQVNKLRVGANGTPFRQMRVGLISTGGAQTFSPAFPTGVVPIIFLASPQSALTNQIWSMQVNSVTNTGFNAVKQYFQVTGTAISGSGSFGENVSYMAIGI